MGTSCWLCAGNAAAAPLTEYCSNNKPGTKKKQTIFNISQIPFRSSFIETSLSSCNRGWRGGRRRENWHHVLVGRHRSLPGPQKFSSRSRIRFCSLSRNSWFFPSPMFSAYSAGREQRDTGFECNGNKGRATTPADTTAESTPTVLPTAKWELMQGASMVFLLILRVKALHNKHLLTLIKAFMADRGRELLALAQADTSTQKHPFPGMGIMPLCPRNANCTINHCKSLAS